MVSAHTAPITATNSRVASLATRIAPTHTPSSAPSGPVTKIPSSGPRFELDSASGPKNPAANATPAIGNAQAITRPTGSGVRTLVISNVMGILRGPAASTPIGGPSPAPGSLAFMTGG